MPSRTADDTDFSTSLTASPVTPPQCSSTAANASVQSQRLEVPPSPRRGSVCGLVEIDYSVFLLRLNRSQLGLVPHLPLYFFSVCQRQSRNLIDKPSVCGVCYGVVLMSPQVFSAFAGSETFVATTTNGSSTLPFLSHIACNFHNSPGPAQHSNRPLSLPAGNTGF